MELSLDEIIKSKRITNRPKPRTSGPTKEGRITKRYSAPMSLPHSFPKGNTNKHWEHDMFQGNRNTNQQTNRMGAKIQISNLDFGVTDEDINELFQEFGTLIKAGVHYDRSGRSLGTAEVTYANNNSAVKARNKYNGIPLDNKPMNIVLIEQRDNVSKGMGDRLQISAQRPRPVSNDKRAPTRPTFDSRPIRQTFDSRPIRQTFDSRPIRKTFEARPNRGTFESRPSEAKKNNKKQPKSKEELDAEMDDYLNKNE